MLVIGEIQKTIKMTPHNYDKIATGKVTFSKINDYWQISLKVFWTKPLAAEMYIVGETARKIMDINAAEGGFSASKKLSDVMWSDFIYKAKMIVIISKDVPILKAVIPPIKSMDIHNAMTIIRCGSQDKVNSTTKKETIKKEIVEKFHLEQIKSEKAKQEIKSILSIRPSDRKRQPAHSKSSQEAIPENTKLIPMNWSIEEIDKCLETSKISSPFIGLMDNAYFTRIEIMKATGFDHMVVGKVDKLHVIVYMLCIPGAAYMPPKGLPEYLRWIPSVAGNGYWVKYITENKDNKKTR